MAPGECDLQGDGGGREINKGAEVRWGAPVGEAGAGREAVRDDGSKIGREGEAELRLDAGELERGEAREDANAGRTKVAEDGFGNRGE